MLDADGATSSGGLKRWVDHPLLWVGALGLIIMMLATLASTISNALFSRPVPDIVTIDEVLMAFVVFLPLAFVQLHREHIEVTLATDWLGPRSKHVLRTFGLFLSILTFGLLTWALFNGALDAWEQNDVYTGEYSIPSWPMRLVAALGALGFVARLVADLFHHLTHPGCSSSPTSSAES